MLFIVLNGCDSNQSVMPTANNGILDLSVWNCNRDSSVRLDGEWSLYRNQLIQPADFSKPDSPKSETTYSVPSSLNFSDLEHDESPFGYATLRLRIIPPQDNKMLRLQLDSINAAYTLWINGECVVQSGVVAKSVKNGMPAPLLGLVPFPETDQPLELVLQLSNYHFHTAGFIKSIWLGTETDLELKENREIGRVMFFVGALLLIGLYHIGLYCFHRKDLLPIYLALYCFLWGGYYFVSGVTNWPVLYFFPASSAALLEKIAWSCFLLSLPVIIKYYLVLYPQEFSGKAFIVIAIFSFFFTGVAFGADPISFATIAPYSFILAASSILYSIICLTRAFFHKRNGAFIILIGTFFLGLSGLIDMLSAQLILSIPSLVTYGVLALAMSQALALSQRFAKSFHAVETLSHQLNKRNLRLKGEIAERTRLEREIVNISEEERRKVSVDLHDGICQQLTGAKLRCAALLHMLQGEDEERKELEKLSDILDELVDQAYDLSCGIWPLEHSTTSTGPSLQDMIGRYSRSSNIPIEFRQNVGCQVCRKMQMTQIYRIAQEAITNAIKHAAPTKIAVSLSCKPEGEITLKVSDNGVGKANATESRGGLGMSIMSHRAMMVGGRLEIVTNEPVTGRGTSVVFTVPCMGVSRGGQHGK